MNQTIKRLPEILPLLPVKESVVFPRMVIPLMIRDEEYSKLIDDALKKEKLIAIAMSKDFEKLEEGPVDVHRVGTAASVIKLSKGDEGTVVVVQGIGQENSAPLVKI